MNFSLKHLLSAAVCAFLFNSASVAQDAPKPATHGIDPSHMDTSVKPGDDFVILRCSPSSANLEGWMAKKVRAAHPARRARARSSG